MRPFALFLCAGLALAPVAASAASPGGVVGDARCLMTMAALANSKDPSRARAAQLGVVYFAGRVKAQDPSYDFGLRLKAVAASLDRDAIIAEAKRCGPMMADAMRELNAAQRTFPPPTAPTAGTAARPAAKP